MKESEFPPHIQLMIDNVREVDRLVEIHRKVGGRRSGRPKNVEVLNKSGVVLLVACWEAFVEEVARQAFDFMVSNATKPSIFPNRVLALAGREIRGDKDETRIWSLAAGGWKEILRSHASQMQQRYIGSFNTPSSKNIDSLFESLIGCRSVSSGWSWTGMSAERAQRKLDALVDLRHEIAHKVKTTRRVQKKLVTEHTDFIQRLAGQLSNQIAKYVESRTDKEPWVQVTYTTRGKGAS